MNRLHPLFLSAALFSALSACSGKPEPAHEAAATEARSDKESGKSEAPAPDSAPVAAISSDSAKAAGIETRIAGPAPVRETLSLFGTIRPNAERQREVRARYPGVVHTVAKRPGDGVAGGELLLSIESNDSLEPYPIRSPIAGTLLERRVNPGEAVDSSQPLLVVADLSSVWAEFAVFGRDLAQVRAGMTISVVSGDDHRRSDAKIDYLAPVSNGDTQSVVARAVLDNRDHRWLAGQFVTGELVIASAKAAVAVAPMAVQKLGDDNVVFVQTDKGFEARKVELGRHDAEAIEVIQGLAAGEHYAATNSFVLKAELLKGSGDQD